MSKMMSLSSFRKNLFQTFNFMKDTSAAIEIYHRRKVYRIHVEETGRKVTSPYQPKRGRSIVPSALIDAKPCPDCGSLLINGVCMNREHGRSRHETISS